MSNRQPVGTSMRVITLRSTQRAREALAMRQQGKKLREIGNLFGVCAETARCMVNKGRALHARQRWRDG
jgi:hypothetical protein